VCSADVEACDTLSAPTDSAGPAPSQVLGALGINTISLPPILNYGSQFLKDLVVRDVVQGRTSICLMISEPTAGSDVTNIKTTAVREGEYFVVNGACVSATLLLCGRSRMRTDAPSSLGARRRPAARSGSR